MNSINNEATHGHAESEGSNQEGGFTLHAPVDDISSVSTPPAPRKAPRTGKGIKQPQVIDLDSDEDDEPNLDDYFAGFRNLDKKRKIAICRGYAAYMAASRQTPGKRSRK